MSKTEQTSDNPQTNNSSLGFVMKRGYYDVQGFDESGNEVDRRNSVIAWTRREAYFDVMHKLKPHKTWDATRIKDHV